MKNVTKTIRRTLAVASIALAGVMISGAAMAQINVTAPPCSAGYTSLTPGSDCDAGAAIVQTGSSCPAGYSVPTGAGCGYQAPSGANYCCPSPPSALYVECVLDSVVTGPTCYMGKGFGQASPEMSDYLAMAFIVVAGGMIYYFRRRALAKA